MKAKVGPRRRRIKKKLEAFQLWEWRKILSLPLTEKKSNKGIIQNVRPNISLEVMTKMLRVRYFGHVMRTHQSLEKDIMLGINAGTRRNFVLCILYGIFLRFSIFFNLEKKYICHDLNPNPCIYIFLAFQCIKLCFIPITYLRFSSTPLIG